MAMTVQTTFSRDPAIGYAGMLDSNVDHDILTMVNAEASASIAFGKGLVFKGSATTDKDAVLPSAQTNPVAGILAHSHNYAAAWTDVTSGTTYGELDGTGLKPGAELNVVRRGRILVVCASGCALGDKLYIRSTAGSGKVVGDLENAADATNMIDVSTKGTWLTAASAGGLAWLDVNF